MMNHPNAPIPPLPDLVYIACPKGKEAKKLAMLWWESLARQGQDAYCACSHRFSSKDEIPTQTHATLAQKIMERCDEMHVVAMPGWEKDDQVKYEINLARRRGIIIRYYCEKYINEQSIETSKNA